jgi:hypothetical protein
MRNFVGNGESIVEKRADEEDFDAPRPFLAPLLRDMRPYRRIILGALGLAALFVAAACLAAWTLYPTEKTASLEFHVDFDGAGNGVYPNGAKFSAEDFLSEPVLRRVFDENGLEKYAKYERFRTSLVVTSVNPDLDILEREYRGRLTDQKLLSLDRLKLEREFREKAAALKTSAFKLTMVRKERLREMDKVLLAKVLRDILAAWADDAAKIRGALQYDLPIYSPAMLQKEFLESEDYLISADLLRRKVNRVSSSIDQLVITIARASRRSLRWIVQICESTGVPTRIIPGLYEILGGRVSVSQVRPVAIDDLVGREPVMLEPGEMRQRPRVDGFGHSEVPRADRARRAGHRDTPGDARQELTTLVPDAWLEGVVKSERLDAPRPVKKSPSGAVVALKDHRTVN